MVKLLITYKDYIHCTVHGLLSADLSACVKEFKVFIPSARFQASYKLGRWDGYKQYFTVTGQTYVNLLPRIFEIIDLSKYEIEYVYPDDIIKDPDLGDDVDSNYFSYLNWYDGHYKEGQPIILEEHQVRVINTCLKNHRCIIDAATGCHSKGTKILMANGQWKNVEEIQINDKVMGDDGTVRNVLSLHNGIDDMYQIIPTKGKPFIVNGGHILPLICNDKRNKNYNLIENISVNEYLKKSKTYKHTHKIFVNMTEINFQNNYSYKISPYVMGCYLGDGSTCGSGQITITSMDNQIVEQLNNEALKNNLKLVEHIDKRGNKAKDYTFNLNNHNDNNIMKDELKRYGLFGLKSKDKFIPDEYKFGNIEARYQLLAGLIDTDGYYDNNIHYYYTNSEQLKDDVVFICGSLGIKTNVHIKKVKKYENNIYYTISICSKNEKIPVKLERKKAGLRAYNKDNRRSGFTIKYIGKGEYYGFEVDKNNLYIMEDWWVQHNSGKTLISAVLAKKVLPFGKTILIVPSKDLAFQSANEFKQWGLDAGIVGCGIRDFGHDVTVCTWQTINSMERSKKEKPLTMEELQQLKDGVISLIFDECHQCKSYHIQQVCDSTFKNVPIKWGLTGTVPKEKSDYYCLYTSLGGVGAVVEAKELQDKGFLANCNINCVRLEDNTLSPDFTTEIKYLESNDERTTFIAQLLHSIVQSSGNTLVLLSHINYGEKLTEKLINLGTNAIFLNGEVKSTKRFEEYEKIKTENNKCIVAIDKIASTGLSISRLFNLVFIDYGKAFTKTIQSVGRGLRLAKDKDFVEIYDISSTTKYSKKHFNERIHYYDEKKYPFRILNIDKWK